MSTATALTREEKSKTLDAYLEAMGRGDREAARKLILQIPIHRALVPFVKEYYSEEEIKELGYIMPASER